MAEKLTPQQLAAVQNRGGQLLVSAAAGSGKTKVLVDRLLSYLSDPADPANIDEFLIITYTKAAAAELRAKIAQKLSESIAAQPHNRHLQQQMQRLYLAKISTVHAFCSDVLRENAYRMDISADFRVADENESVQLQNQAMEQVLEEAYANIESDADLRVLIDTQGFGRDDRSIPGILLRVYRSAMCHQDPERWLTWCEDQSGAQGITDAAQTIWGEFLLADLHDTLDLHMQALEACVQRVSENGTIPKVLSLLQDTIAQLKTLRQCNTWDGIVTHPSLDFGRLTFPKTYTDLQLADQIKAIRNACKEELASKLCNFSDDSKQVLTDLRETSAAASALIRLVRRFRQQYELLKNRRRILDYADLEHKTLDLMLGKKRTGITVAAGEIGARFREVMVDEYQDTNGVQDAIFTALTQRRKNCFMVGDVKQSIYQFRLADPGIFLEKYETYAPADQAADGEGRKIVLSRNFRSSTGVIQAVNDVFGNCMSVKVGGLEYTDDEKLHTGTLHIPLDETEVELYGIRVQQDTYAEEAAFVADRVCQLLDGKHMIRQADTLRPIQPKDIVILMRSPRSVGAEFQYALQLRDIPCNSGDSQDLLQTEEVCILISLLQTIVNPQQDIPLLAVLASRVFGFTADELAHIRSKNKYCSFYDALRGDGGEKSVHFIKTLKALREDAQHLKLTQLLEKILLRTDLLSVFMAMVDGEARCANVHDFLQIASDFANGAQRDLIQFLEYIQLMEAQGLKSSGDKKAADAVTIMSIHSSKGLEFPVVFLCGLSRAFNRDSLREQVLCHKDLGLGLSCVDVDQRVRYPSIAKRAVAVKIAQESVSEELRVLYVAMTRSKDRLIMTYARQNLEKNLHETAMRLSLSPKALMTAQVDCPGQWVIQTALKKTEAGAFFKIAGNPGCAAVSNVPWFIDVADCTAAEDILDKETRQSSLAPAGLISQIEGALEFSYAHQQVTRIPSKQTATQLKGRQKDQEIAENTRKKQATLFRKPSFIKHEQSGKVYGTAVHLLLQHADFHACTTVSGVEKEISRLRDANLISKEQGEMIEPAHIVTFFRSELGRKLLDGEQVLREFKFSLLVDAQKFYPGVTGEEILLQGVVDCAIVEEDGITVIDFKTDRVTEDTVGSVAAGYAAQVEAYKYAMQKIYNLPVKIACLHFLRIGKTICL